MTELSGIGPLERRRGVAPGIFLIWIILAAVGGAIAWGMYGNDVRSILKLPPAGAPAHWVSTQTSQTQSTIISANEIIGLVKDLQASQQRTADDVRTVLQLLTSEQAATKSLSDAVAALQAKVDAIQRPLVAVAKKPAPSAPRKPSPPLPPSASPVQDQPEPEPSAPTSIVRPEGR
jgi:uncharacterized iron-regulated membrane protein